MAKTATAVGALRKLDADVVSHVDAAARACCRPLAIEFERLYAC